MKQIKFLGHIVHEKDGTEEIAMCVGGRTNKQESARESHV